MSATTTATTTVVGPFETRPFDTIDLTVAEAMILQVLGPDGAGAIRVEHVNGQVRAHISPAGREALLRQTTSADAGDLEGWLLLAVTALTEQTVDIAGDMWRHEAELAVELLAAERFDDMRAIAVAAADGPLVADNIDAAQIAAGRVCDPVFVALI